MAVATGELKTAVRSGPILEQLRAIEKMFIQKNQGKMTRVAAAELMQLHERMAKLQFPDVKYMDYLKKHHVDRDISTYLEVGVRWGDALALANEGCYAVGVDPQFDIKHTLKVEPHLFGVLSDDFFFEHTETYSNFFEMIFLDGLHEAHQTMKDIYHSFAVLKEGGEILAHDMLPVALSVATPTQQTRFWTGNVWQSAAAFCVPGRPYKWEFVPAFPSGLFRLYDIDPDYRPSAKDTVARLQAIQKLKFGNTSELLDYIHSL